MLKKITLSAAAAITAIAAVPAAADAQPRGRAHGYYNNSAHARAYQGDRYYRGDRYGAYSQRDAYGRDYRGYDSRVRYDRCNSGTTGTIVGGAAGALLGREVAGRGDRTVGAVLGGVLGAVAGRAVTRDRNC